MPPSPPEYCTFLIAICLPSSEWAAWVQAVGSVVAIGAAIWIAAWQRRNDHLREAAREKAQAFQKMEVLVSLANRANWQVDSLPKPGASQAEVDVFLATVRTDEFDRTINALREFGPSDVPDGSALVQVLGLIRCLGDARDMISTYQTWQGLGRGTDLKFAHQQAEKIKDLSEASRKVLLFIQSKYGPNPLVGRAQNATADRAISKNPSTPL